MSFDSPVWLRSCARMALLNWRHSVAAATLVVLCGVDHPAAAQTYPLPAPVYLSGTATATITVNFGTAPPSGSTISCSLSLISNDPRSPSDTQNATVTTTGGSSVICPVAMNYRWRLTNPAADTMTIAYAVQGPTQSSSGIVNIIPMPADGYVANMVFTVNQ